MSMLDGVSQCWPLAKDCVVWWEAWTAVFSFVAFISTLFLGLMTLFLGKAANRASARAVEIAGIESKARDQMLRDERTLILMMITGELALVFESVKRMNAAIRVDETKDEFLSNSLLRDRFYEPISRLCLSTTRSWKHRWHVIGHPLAAHLARAVAVTDGLIEDSGRLQSAGDNADFGHGAGMIEFSTSLITKELVPVLAECTRVIKSLGLDDPSIVEQAEKLRASRAK